MRVQLFFTFYRYSDFVVRELKVTHGEGGKSRQIFHYHYLQWKESGGVNHSKITFFKLER